MTKHFGAAAICLCSAHPHAFRALQDVRYTRSSRKMNIFSNPFFSCLTVHLFYSGLDNYLQIWTQAEALLHIEFSWSLFENLPIAPY